MDNKELNIIEYLSGLTPYLFDKAVLKRIAFDRGLGNIVDCRVLTQKEKDLLRADILYTAYLSPNTIASYSAKHGNYSKSIGQQTISADEKERLYNSFINIYRKYNDEKLEEIESSSSNLQWIPL